jgi:hypothetical protein
MASLQGNISTQPREVGRAFSAIAIDRQFDMSDLSATLPE